jgi:hypothetical protein
VNRVHMLVLGVLAFAAVGCAQIEAKVNKDIQAVATPDLQNALAIAKAQPVVDADHVGCWSGLLNYTQALPTVGADTPLPAVNGIASLLEVETDAVNSVDLSQPLLPPLDRATEKSCLFVLSQNAAAKAKLAALLAGIGKGRGILNDAQAIKAAAALSAHR